MARHPVRKPECELLPKWALDVRAKTSSRGEVDEYYDRLERELSTPSCEVRFDRSFRDVVEEP